MKLCVSLTQKELNSAGVWVVLMATLQLGRGARRSEGCAHSHTARGTNPSLVLAAQKVLRPGLLFFGCHLHPSFTFLWFSRKTKSATYLSSSTDKLGCTLLSKRDKPNRCGRLSDLWHMPNTAMDGCSGFSRFDRRVQPFDPYLRIDRLRFFVCGETT